MAEPRNPKISHLILSGPYCLAALPAALVLEPATGWWVAQVVGLVVINVVVFVFNKRMGND